MLQDTQILATEVKDELRFGFTTQLFGDGACIEAKGLFISGCVVFA